LWWKGGQAKRLGLVTTTKVEEVEERLQRLGKVEGWWAWMTVKVQARRSVEIS
jgi:endonuclease III